MVTAASKRAAVLVLAAALASPLSATAETLDTPLEAQIVQTRLWLDAAGLYVKAETQHLWYYPNSVIFPMAARGHVLVHPNIAVNFALPWLASIPLNTPLAPFTTPGGMTVGAEGLIVNRIGRRDTLALSAGLSLSLPGYAEPSPASISLLEMSSLVVADRQTGYSEHGEYFPMAVTVRPHAAMDATFSGWSIRFQGSLMFTGNQLLLAGTLEVDHRLFADFSGGVHVDGAIDLMRPLTNGGGVEPYLAYEPPGGGVFVRAALRINGYFAEGDDGWWFTYPAVRVGYRF